MCQRPRITASSTIVVEEVRQLLGAGLRRMLKREGSGEGYGQRRGRGTGRERRRISVTMSQPQVQRMGIRESKFAKNTSGPLYMVGPQRRTPL